MINGSSLAYLRQLQAKTDFSLRLDPELMRHRLRQYGQDAKAQQVFAHAPTVEEMERIFRKDLVEPLLEHIPVENRKQIVEVPVGLLATHEVNAWAVRTPEGAPLVVLNSELAALLSFWKEVQFATGSLISQGQVEKAETLHQRCVDFICTTFQVSRADPYPLVPVDLPLEEFNLVQAATFACEVFIIAHEFAHITLGHLGSTSVRHLKGGTGKTSLETFNASQNEEFAADMLAFSWILNFAEQKETSSLWLVAKMPIMSIEFFVLLHYIERVMGYSFAETSDHPSSAARLIRLYNEFAPQLDELNRNMLKDWVNTVTKNI